MFIVLEGCDGSGKTTQIELLRTYFEGQGKEVRTIRNPGYGMIGEGVRRIFKKHAVNGYVMAAEPALFLIGANIIDNSLTMDDWLSEEYVVLCDRWITSAYVYQSSIGGISRRRINEFLKFIGYIPEPDYLFILDVDSKVAKERLEKREESAEKDLDRIIAAYSVEPGMHLPVSGLEAEEVRDMILAHIALAAVDKTH